MWDKFRLWRLKRRTWRAIQTQSLADADAQRRIDWMLKDQEWTPAMYARLMQMINELPEKEE